MTVYYVSILPVRPPEVGKNTMWQYAYILRKKGSQTICFFHFYVENIKYLKTMLIFSSSVFLSCIAYLLDVCSYLLAHLNLPLAFPDLVMSASQPEPREI